MNIQVFCTCNFGNKEVSKWIQLPLTTNELTKTIKEISPNLSDNFSIKDYKLDLDLDIPTEDIYELNEIISKFNSSGATDEEIQAITEISSSYWEDVLEKVQHGRYKFFPNKSLTDVAYSLANTSPYKYYRISNDEIDITKIIDDLTRLGYEETSTGVIQLLESC